MPRAADADVLALLRDAAPGFVPSGPVRRTVKSHWCEGRLRETPAIAKCITHVDPIWRWYFLHELAVYRRFARRAPAVRVPAVLHVEPAASLLVLERLAGPPLATRRYPDAPLDDEETALALAAVVRALRSYRYDEDDGEGNALAPEDLARFRARILEDPRGGFAWIRDGLARCVRDGVLTPRDEALALEGLRRLEQAAPLCFAHGDLLLRNVLRDGRAVALVDWECAGLYARDWDAALCWVGLGARGRARFERALFEEGEPDAGFLACVLFALARELRLARVTFRAAREAPATRALDEALGETVARLGRALSECR